MKIKSLFFILPFILFYTNSNAQEVLVHSESFEDDVTPWTTNPGFCTEYPWRVNTIRASDGNRSVIYQSYDATAGCSALLISPLITINNAVPDDSISMQFDIYRSSDFPTKNDRIELYFRNSSNVSVGPLPTPVIHRHYAKSPSSSVGWVTYVYKVKLSNAGTGPNISCRFEFKGISDYGQNMFLDNIRIYHIKKSSELILTNPNGGNVITAKNSYNITWNMEKINKVKLDYTVDGGLSWVNIDSNINASDLAYTWIAPNLTSQACKVRITDMDNPSKMDESDSYFTISTQTSVATFEYQSFFNVYPNPVKDKLFVDYTGQSSILNFAFYSVDGKFIFSGSNNILDNSTVIDVSNKLANGIYFIEISDIIETRRLKIIVSND